MFGFLSVEDENGDYTGNAGLKDQQAAMQWVQDNIEAFGGNKDLVRNNKTRVIKIHRRVLEFVNYISLLRTLKIKTW